MPAQLSLSVVLIDRTYNGRGDGGEPEWPPSPLRVFQALVAAAGRLGEAALSDAGPALRWLEAQPAPTVVAPASQPGVPVRIAVPNNDLDVVAADWARGRPPRRQPAELKTMKTLAPTYLLDGDTVRFLWPLPDGDAGHVPALARLARSVVALGWGQDLVAANAEVVYQDKADALAGERWLPVSAGGDGLRVPQPGTLDALIARHNDFLSRLPESGGFVPVPPLTAFRVVGYRRPGDVSQQPFAAFKILRPDADGFRPFDTVRSSRVVAGRVRHAADRAAEDAGRPREWRATFIHGHAADAPRPARGDGADDRLMFLPLPSINRYQTDGGYRETVSSVPRVLVVAPPGADAEAVWVRRFLNGCQLIDEDHKQPVAVLSMIVGKDTGVDPYVDKAAVWSTVTPVILPGHELRNKPRATRMIRRAFEQSGWPAELVTRAEIDFHPCGFRHGVMHAAEYLPPDHQRNYARTHVRITWPTPVPGPICVGAGRYYGYGLFAAERT